MRNLLPAGVFAAIGLMFCHPAQAQVPLATIRQMMKTRACVKCDLRGVDLSNKSLQGFDLRGADLSEANFTFSNLTKANLQGAILDGAKLYATKLVSADLSFVQARSADFDRANLSDANLTGASLQGAQFASISPTPSLLAGADFRCANLVGSKGFPEYTSVAMNLVDLITPSGKVVGDVNRCPVRNVQSRNPSIPRQILLTEQAWNNLRSIARSRNITVDQLIEEIALQSAQP